MASEDTIQVPDFSQMTNREEMRQAARSVLDWPEDKLDELIAAAFELRRAHRGMRVGVQLLTNARSGNCSQNCAYCAQSGKADTGIETYSRIDDERLFNHNDAVRDYGLERHCIGLSGVAFKDEEIEDLAERIRKMKAEGAPSVCCSIGFLTRHQAEVLHEAGLDRINHNLNTSRAHYPAICTTHTYQRRIDNIKMLQEVGFEICCGGIIGMGETKDDIVDMLLDVNELHPESVPINFLLPIKGTRLENQDISHMTPQYCLRVLCLARLLNPTSDVRCAAGREVYFKGFEKELFSVVDSIFASGYLTESGEGIEATIRDIEAAGFEFELESSDE